MSLTGIKATAHKAGVAGFAKPDARLAQATFRRFIHTVVEHRWQLLYVLLAVSLMLVAFAPRACDTCPPVPLRQPAIKGYTCVAGQDYNGNDLTGSTVQHNTQECADACTARPQCDFFVYETTGNCWLKRDLNRGRNGSTKRSALFLAGCIKMKSI